MFATRVVETADVFEEAGFNLAAGLPAMVPNEFSLQVDEEVFGGGIVIMVALQARRSLEPLVVQQLLVVAGAVLRSAIRVMNAF